MICTFNFSTSTTRDISKLSQISLLTACEITYNNFEVSLVVFMQISLQIMLLPILICNFKFEISKLPWQPSVRFRVKMATNFYHFMNEDGRALKEL